MLQVTLTKKRQRQGFVVV